MCCREQMYSCLHRGEASRAKGVYMCLHYIVPREIYIYRDIGFDTGRRELECPFRVKDVKECV